MGTKNNPGQYDCYEKAEDDEPIFVVLARDKHAPAFVRLWARTVAGEGSQHQDKIDEAYQCARQMEDWYRQNRNKT